MQMLRRLPYPYPVIALFLIVFAFSLRFIYIEGDDARSIAYHALGRNSVKLPPYAPYHGMMDRILSVLPPIENLVFPAALLLTAFSGIAFFLLCMQLGFRILNITDKGIKTAIALITLAAAPEFFFFCLVYMPSLPAMALVVGAHLILRNTLLRNTDATSGSRPSIGKLVLAAIMFGFAFSCRWDVILYGAVIAADLALLSDANGKGLRLNLKQWPYILGWGVLALVLSFGFLYLSGYNLNHMASMFGLANTLSDGQSINRMFAIAALLPFFSPAFVLFCLAGVYFLFHGKQFKLLAICAISILFSTKFLYTGVPKAFIFSLPGYVLLFHAGLKGVLFSATNRIPRWSLAVVTLIFALPWLTGVKVWGASSWGPGFEVTEVKKSIGDKSKGMKIRPVVGPGMAFATAEGARPLMGYAYVLLGGWKGLYQDIRKERQDIIRASMEKDIPILQLERSSLLMGELLSDRYTTGHTYKSDGKKFIHMFFAQPGDQGRVSLYMLSDRKYLQDRNCMDSFAREIRTDRFILYSTYTSAHVDLFRKYPGAATPIGVFHTEVNLGKYLSQLRTEASKQEPQARAEE